MTSNPGGKTVGQMKAEHESWLDEQRTTTRCAFCRWRYVGPASVGREQAAAHRMEKHPDLKPRSRGEIEQQIRKDKTARKETLTQMAPPKRMDPPKAESKGRVKWTRERALEALAAHVAEQGRTPTTKETIGNRTLPPQTAAERLFGSWGNYIVAGGFPRPKRGRKAQTAATNPGDPPPAEAPEAAPGPAGIDPQASQAPCSEGLVQFLYVLMRDELPTGAVHAIVTGHVEKGRGRGVTFTNAHLEAYARELAARLLQSDDPKGS